MKAGFGNSNPGYKFAVPLNKGHAGVAQLVEHHLAKVRVASSSLVSRSRFPSSTEAGILFFGQFVILFTPEKPGWWNW